MYGIIKDDKGKVAVSNIIFETIILDYYISVFATGKQEFAYIADDCSCFVKNGKLDMVWALNRFAMFMRSEYNGPLVKTKAKELCVNK